MAKNLVLGTILAHLTQIGPQNFFFQKSWSAIIMYNIRKTNDPILRKLSDGRTDGQTDKSDFIGRCPTNVERPETQKKKLCKTDQLRDCYPNP